MKKNSITNKITPCCGLPFSVVYWWVSNLTLNSESDRQFIISNISQNGIISIDGWKVLVNSGTLETDASLTKAEFLAWFDCGKQPTCEQLKLLIEGFVLGNWKPEKQIINNEFFVNSEVNILTNVNKETGKYIDDSNGNTVNHEPYTTTDFIPLIDGVHYSFGKYLTNSFFAFYDENKNFVSDTRSHNRIFDFKTPVGARFVRLSYLSANENDIYLVAKTDIISNDWGVDLLKNIKFDEGFFVSQSSGGNNEASWTAVSDFIPILPKQAFGINPNTYQQFAFYDENLQYLPNDFSANNKKDFIVPDNAYYFRMTVNIADLGVNYLKLKNPKFINNYIEIGKEKTDFETIQNAINYANSTGEVHTINIAKGLYLEGLKNYILPHIFFGEKSQTIISDVNDSDQKWETLQVATGYFEGIYFKREGGGYAVHVDYAGVGVAEFFNCRIESAYGSAIGHGQQQDQNVKFRNCQIIQRVAEASTGIIYTHNAVNENVTGGNIEFWNCEIDGFDRIVRIDDANQIYGNDSGVVGRFKPLFVGNNFRSKNYGVQLDLRNGSKTTYAGAIIGRIVLDERSFGNNISELNY